MSDDLSLAEVGEQRARVDDAPTAAPATSGSCRRSPGGCGSSRTSRGDRRRSRASGASTYVRGRRRQLRLHRRFVGRRLGGDVRRAEPRRRRRVDRRIPSDRTPRASERREHGVAGAVRLARPCRGRPRTGLPTRRSARPSAASARCDGVVAAAAVRVEVGGLRTPRRRRPRRPAPGSPSAGSPWRNTSAPADRSPTARAAHVP